MCKRTEDDLTDEINCYETVFTAASTMTTWQLDCSEIRLTVLNNYGCAVTECYSVF